MTFDAAAWVAQADAAGLAPRLSYDPNGAPILGCAGMAG